VEAGADELAVDETEGVSQKSKNRDQRPEGSVKNLNLTFEQRGLLTADF
jgi:hypothetical protein